MLTEREEYALKQLAKANMPMQPQQPPQSEQLGDTGQHVAQLVHRALKVRPRPADAMTEDPAVMSKLENAGIREAGKKPGDYYALGLSRYDILTLGATALRSRVELLRTRAEQEFKPKQGFKR
jgi:hypothetical protein